MRFFNSSKLATQKRELYSKAWERKLPLGVPFAQSLGMPFWKKCHGRLGIEAKADAANDVEGHKLQVIPRLRSDLGFRV